MPRDDHPHNQTFGEIVDGASVLDEVHHFLGRFVAYPSGHARVAHVLWIAHTHLMNAWESTPRIAFLSPEPASGKTRALEVTSLLVPNPVEAVNVSPAYLFRKVGDIDQAPTILHDEIDTVFGPKAPDNEGVRGLLNAGHRRGAITGRCVVRGKTVETEEIEAYSAVALAGLGDLPDTILTRAVIVRMRRRAPGEHVEPYRRRLHCPEGNQLRDRLAAWADTVLTAVSDVWPDMPHGVEDRDADVWEALLAVADAAGGNWPGRARDAAVAFVTEAKEQIVSLGVRLLADLCEVFGDKDAMPTVDILSALHGMEEAPWSDLKGKPINERGLAARLRPYNIRSKVIRIGAATPRGYAREDLHDAWIRYVPSLFRGKSATCATRATSPEIRGLYVADSGAHVADQVQHDDRSATEKRQKSANVAGVAHVEDFQLKRETGERGEGSAAAVIEEEVIDHDVAERAAIQEIDGKLADEDPFEIPAFLDRRRARPARGL